MVRRVDTYHMLAPTLKTKGNNEPLFCKVGGVSLLVEN